MGVKKLEYRRIDGQLAPRRVRAPFGQRSLRRNAEQFLAQFGEERRTIAQIEKVRVLDARFAVTGSRAMIVQHRKTMLSSIDRDAQSSSSPCPHRSAVTLAAFAAHAEFHRPVHLVARKPSTPSWPETAIRSVLARPRARDSSRVTR